MTDLIPLVAVFVTATSALILTAASHRDRNTSALFHAALASWALFAIAVIVAVLFYKGEPFPADIQQTIRLTASMVVMVPSLYWLQRYARGWPR